MAQVRRFDTFIYDTSADTDVLGGSVLDKMPVSGTLTLRMASTVVTATVAINATLSPSPSEGAANGVPLIANGVPLTTSPFYRMYVQKDEKVTVNLGGTTGTVGTWATLEGVEL